ncbi:MAG: hypothetical protein OXU20_27205 [Myxococcales bacterium]|nr:hypothetical protein [Myxococcales bacterium]
MTLRWTDTRHRGTDDLVRLLGVGALFWTLTGCAPITQASPGRQASQQAMLATSPAVAMATAQREVDQYLSELRDRFNGETADPRGSRDPTLRIQQAFEQDREGAPAILEMQCRTTLCRLRTTGDPSDVGQVLHRALPSLSGHFSASVMTQERVASESAQTTVYLLRKQPGSRR